MSPFRFRQYGESGTWVSDLMPHIANHVDDLCFLHSMQADSNNHAPASYQLHTGDIRAGKASLGSWTTYGLGTENADLPGYVVLFDAGPLGGAANYTSGFLPPAFQPTRMRDRGLPVLDLVPSDAFAKEQREAIDLMQQLNRSHRERYPGFLELDARIASYELAYRMQSAALEVGRFEEEPQHIHQLYGIDHEDRRTQSFSRKCLMARRLVERGVRFVQLYDMPDKDGWDAHDRLVENHIPRARWTDIGVAGLIADLKQRGLLESTLVVWASEFGRTPMKQGNLGRQHNAAGFTIWMAGGGVRPGMHVGATDELGLMAVERPIQFRDLHATILTALGIEYDDLYYVVNGRDERLTGVAGSAKPLTDILLLRFDPHPIGSLHASSSGSVSALLSRKIPFWGMHGKILAIRSVFFLVGSDWICGRCSLCVDMRCRHPTKKPPIQSMHFWMLHGANKVMRGLPICIGRIGSNERRWT
jgi:hypothetical protein